MSQIEMPVPPPEPSPFSGPGSYEWEFNVAYYQSRGPKLQPFFYGRPGAMPGDQLSPADAMALADKLYQEVPRVPFDEEIDAEGMAPYSTMYERSVVYGYTRVPYGQGDLGPNIPVNDDDFKGPVVPGYLAVSIDIKDFPPYKA